MPTPSIQTLVTDAQQILNLDSISAVRSVVAVALANANTGTPLNPNLTTQQLWNEFYQVVNKPKSDIESIIANQLMKLLYAPPAPGGAGADQQVIFNDGGVLAGDSGLKYNKATDALTIGGAVGIGGAANFNGGALAAYLNGFLMFGSSGNTVNLFAQSSGLHIKNNSGTFPLLTINNSGDFTIQDGAGNGRMTLNAIGLNVANGNVILGTSGKGIDFSATPSGSGTMTSELLNDYEEGTWTPTLVFATPGTSSITYNAQAANYTKVGRVVTVNFRIAIAAGGFVKGTAAGAVSIQGLPFTVAGQLAYRYIDLGSSILDISTGSVALMIPISTGIGIETISTSGSRVQRDASSLNASAFAATNASFITISGTFSYIA